MTHPREARRPLLRARRGCLWCVWGCRVGLSCLTLISSACGRTNIGSGGPRVGHKAQVVALDNTQVQLLGRGELRGGRYRLGYPGAGFRVLLNGRSLAVRGSSTSGKARFAVLQDGRRIAVVQLPRWPRTLTVFEAAKEDVAPYEIEFVHLNETWQGEATLSSLSVEGELQPPRTRRLKLLFVGDSVTCGEGVYRQPNCAKNEQSWDVLHSYGGLVARRLNAEAHFVCFGGRGLVRDYRGRSDVLNAPQFFELAVPSDSAPASWSHGQFRPDAVVVSLGTNDFNLALGAFPSRDAFVGAALAFLARVRAVYPGAWLVVTQGAIVSDTEVGQRATLIDYLETSVREFRDPKVRFYRSSHQPGDACDAHPTEAQHQVMASELQAVLWPLLEGAREVPHD